MLCCCCCCLVCFFLHNDHNLLPLLLPPLRLLGQSLPGLVPSSHFATPTTQSITINPSYTAHAKKPQTTIIHPLSGRLVLTHIYKHFPPQPISCRLFTLTCNETFENIKQPLFEDNPYSQVLVKTISSITLLPLLFLPANGARTAQKTTLMSADLRTALNCLRHPSSKSSNHTLRLFWKTEMLMRSFSIGFMPVSRSQLSRVHTGDSIQNISDT